MIKTAIFDIGNVLLFFSHEKMYRQISVLTGLEYQTVLNKFLEVGGPYEEGKLNLEDLYTCFSTIGKSPFPKDLFVDALTDIFEPNTSVYPVIENLKKKGVKLLLLSNICDAHYEHIISNYEIFKNFDLPILSFQVKARKPQKAIFFAALEAAGCAPDECFYTDDILEFVQAAQNLGIQACPYTTTPLLIDQLNLLLDCQ